MRSGLHSAGGARHICWEAAGRGGKGGPWAARTALPDCKGTDVDKVEESSEKNMPRDPRDAAGSATRATSLQTRGRADGEVASRGRGQGCGTGPLCPLPCGRRVSG